MAPPRSRPAAQPAPPPAGQTAPPNFDAFVAASTAGELLPPEAVAVGTPVLGALTLAAAAQALAGILSGFDAFNRKRAVQLRSYLIEVLPRLHPDRTPAELLPFVRDEMARDRAFVRNQRERLRRDLGLALKLDTMAKRRLRIQAILDRERRYTQMREQAALQRAAARASFLNVREESPEGAYWVLGLAATHTPDCVAMSGNFWPWEVLDHLHPLLHHGCQCELLSKADAVERGLMSPDQVPDTADAVRRAAQIARQFHLVQEAATPEEIREYLDAIIEEAMHWDRRFPKGTHEGGKFMPKGGVGHPILARQVIERALRKLVPHVPQSAADRRRDHVGEWREIAGRQVFVPEHRAFEREVGGRMWYSPPGSTAVHAQADYVKRSPEMPRERGADLSDTAMKQRQEWRQQARDVGSRALARQEPGTPPAEIGAHPKATHGGLLDAGFRLHGQQIDPESGAITHGYLHLASGAESNVTYQGGAVTKVDWTPGSTQDVKPMLTRAPANVQEFLDDMFSITHDLAARNDRTPDLARVTINDSLNDTAGQHTWDGVMELGRDVRNSITRLAQARAEGRPLNFTESREVYKAYRTAVHEAQHAAAPISQRLFTSNAAARGLEEALAEELAGVDVVDVLRRQGLTEVLQWLKANPSDGVVEGTYSHYREALSRILDRGKIPPEKRLDVLHILKFGFDPEQRVSGLAALVTEGGRGHEQNHEQALAWINDLFSGADRRQNADDDLIFAPNIRPDLADVADEAPVVVRGAEIHPGTWVDVRGQTARVQKIHLRDEGPLFDVQFGSDHAPSGVATGVHPKEIMAVRSKPQGSFPGGAEVKIGETVYRPGDRVSYSDGVGGRTQAMVERVIRVQNFDMKHPERGWQIEARTAGGEPVLLDARRTPDIQKEGEGGSMGFLRRTPGEQGITWKTISSPTAATLHRASGIRGDYEVRQGTGEFPWKARLDGKFVVAAHTLGQVKAVVEEYDAGKFEDRHTMVERFATQSFPSRSEVWGGAPASLSQEEFDTRRAALSTLQASLPSSNVREQTIKMALGSVISAGVQDRLKAGHGETTDVKIPYPKDLGRWENWDAELVPISTLLPMRDAQPTTTPEKIAAMREKIRADGIIEPVIVDHAITDGRTYVSEGNNRLEAARAEGFTHVPTRVITVTRVHERHGGVFLPPREDAPQYAKPSDIGLPSMPIPRRRSPGEPSDEAIPVLDPKRDRVRAALGPLVGETVRVSYGRTPFTGVVRTDPYREGRFKVGNRPVEEWRVERIEVKRGNRFETVTDLSGVDVYGQVAEGAFEERLHPRGRGGRFVRVFLKGRKSPIYMQVQKLDLNFIDGEEVNARGELKGNGRVIAVPDVDRIEELRPTPAGTLTKKEAVGGQAAREHLDLLFLAREEKPWVGRLTEDERDALDAYRSPRSFQEINGALRGAGGKTDADFASILVKNEGEPKTLVRRPVGEWVSLLDAAINKAPPTGVSLDMVMYRGVLDTMAMFGHEPKIGQRVTDPAYVSTTTYPETARAFAQETVGWREDKPVDPSLIEVEVPPGTKGAWMPGVYGLNEANSEFVLPRGSTFEVIAVRHDLGAKPGELLRVVEMRMVVPVQEAIEGISALWRLEEGAYEEVLHPRGRAGKWVRKLDSYHHSSGRAVIHDNGPGLGPAKGGGRWAVEIDGKWKKNVDTLVDAKAHAEGHLEAEPITIRTPGVPMMAADIVPAEWAVEHGYAEIVPQIGFRYVPYKPIPGGIEEKDALRMLHHYFTGSTDGWIGNGKGGKAQRDEVVRETVARWHEHMVQRGWQFVSEGAYEEALHPRGRAGKWVKKGWRELTPGDRVRHLQTGEHGIVEHVQAGEKGVSQGTSYVRVKWEASGSSGRVSTPGMNIEHVPPAVAFEGDWGTNEARRAEVGRTVENLLGRYDVPLKKVQVRESEEFDQLAGKSNDTIYLSPRYLDDKFMAEHMKKWSQVSVTKNPADIVVHEFGHIVDGLLAREHKDAYAKLGAFFEEKVPGVGGKPTPRLKAGLEAPSAYGSENRYEFFAEGFTDWVLNGEKAHSSSQFIGKLADEVLGPKRSSRE